MITRITLDLADDQRRAISGKRALATRKEITAFVIACVHSGLRERGAQVNGDAPAPSIILRDGSDTAFSDPRQSSCTNLDHCYPLGPKASDTRCFCGKRTWGGVR